MKRAQIGVAMSSLDHLIYLAKDEDLMEKMKGPLKELLDRVTVSDPIEDDALMEIVRDQIFKTP